MTLSNWFTVIGLLSDIVGVIMVFIYGLPSKVKEKGSAFGGTESSEQQRQRLSFNRNVEIRAKWGLRLLIAGFVFQLIANFIPAFIK